MEKNNIISPNKFGFCSSMSTSDALLKVVNEITKGINLDQKPLAVFLDLKKAFDTVSHTILLERLYRYGIRDIVLNLLSSYLLNRFQQVKINNQLSRKVGVEYVVPQGTVLDPILYKCCLHGLYKSFVQA